MIFVLAMDWIDRYIKAGKADIEKNELVSLAFSTDCRIRRRVAENPRAPKNILRVLSKDSDAEVRLAVAGNPSTPEQVLRELARDADPTVRHGIAEDPRTPEGVLLSLAQDENAYVSCRAVKTLARLSRGRTDNHCVQFAWTRFDRASYA